ncbi:MAG: hypothetical protein ACI9CQ_004324, partial [Saprospiraceae bacterium]
SYFLLSPIDFKDLLGYTCFEPSESNYFYLETF